MRILAVDDDPDFLEVLQWHFEQAGIETRIASSGRAALELIETEHFDVALVDFIMPAMDGRTLVRHIRARPRHADLPVVMMTHMSNVGRIDPPQPDDAHHFVNKLGEPAWLIHYVRELAGRR
jgi:CheY-like chemotaxis protein